MPRYRSSSRSRKRLMTRRERDARYYGNHSHHEERERDSDRFSHSHHYHHHYHHYHHHHHSRHRRRSERSYRHSCYYSHGDRGDRHWEQQSLYSDNYERHHDRQRGYYRSRSHTPHRRRKKSYDSYDSYAPKDLNRDREGHLILEPGDIIQNRYKFMNILGKGTFGMVNLCTDLTQNKVVAMKVIRNVDRYREAANQEINVLDTIKKKDPTGKFHCVMMLEWFDYYGHMCISFETLGLSLFEFLKDNSHQPYPLHQVRHIAYQICYAVNFIHQIKLTHTDLKPENILFINSDYEMYYDSEKKMDKRIVKDTRIKLIDFGSATFDHEHHSSTVCTRHYRPPEVILKLGWDQSCDVWSVGCILFEIYTGITLFMTHSNLEHLAIMEKTLGPFPKSLIQSQNSHYFSSRTYGLKLNSNSSAAKYVNKECKPLKEYMLSGDTAHCQLYNLIESLLTYNKDSRKTMKQALIHPFFDPVRSQKENGISTQSVSR